MGTSYSGDHAYARIITIEYIATGVSPHSGTTRASYTIPSEYRGRVLGIYIRLSRATAASAAGWVHGLVAYTPYGGTQRSVVGQAHNNNAVGYTLYHNTVCGLMMHPGDVIAIQTADGSTGGTCDYYITVQIGIY